MKFIEISELERKIETYEDLLSERELSEVSIKKYLGDIRRFLKYLHREEIFYISEKTMVQYKDYIYANYSVNSYNSYFISLNAYFRFLKMDFLFVKLCRVSKRQSLENVVTIEEYNKLLEYTKTKQYRSIHFVIRTLGCTGIRISELKYITVEALLEGKTEVTAKNRTRMIYFNDILTGELLNYCTEQNIESGIVFRSRNSVSPLSSVTIWRKLKAAAEKAGVDTKKVYPHSFRHLFAKRYIEKFHAIDELADLLGHNSIETTRIYTRTTGEEKRCRLNMLGL